MPWSALLIAKGLFLFSFSFSHGTNVTFPWGTTQRPTQSLEVKISGSWALPSMKNPVQFLIFQQPVNSKHKLSSPPHIQYLVVDQGQDHTIKLPFNGGTNEDTPAHSNFEIPPGGHYKVTLPCGTGEGPQLHQVLFIGRNPFVHFSPWQTSKMGIHEWDSPGLF